MFGAHGGDMRTLVKGVCRETREDVKACVWAEQWPALSRAVCCVFTQASSPLLHVERFSPFPGGVQALNAAILPVSSLQLLLALGTQASIVNGGRT